jgi:hypothetical protein
MGSVAVTALSHCTDRSSLLLYCLLRLSDIVESGIGRQLSIQLACVVSVRETAWSAFFKRLLIRYEYEVPFALP